MRPYVPIPNFPKPIVVPLYCSEAGITTHQGTGILLTSGNRQFLGTAHHVVGSGKEHTLIAACPEPFRLGEFFYPIPEPDSPMKTDLHDLALTELSREQSERLMACSRFLPLDTDTPLHPLGGDRQFLRAFGFLGDDNDNLPKIGMTANGLYLDMVNCQNSLSHDHRKQWKNAFIAGYYRPDVFGGLKPEFRGKRRYGGMSGGALFYGDPACPGLFSEFAGMLISVKVDKRGRALFIALRTRIILEYLHRWFPGLPELKPPTQSIFRQSYLR